MSGFAEQIRALARALREEGVTRFSVSLRFGADEDEDGEAEPEEPRPIGFVEHVGGDQLGLSDAEIDLAYEDE